MTAGTFVPPIQFTTVGFLAPQPTAVLAGVQLDIDAAYGRNLNYGTTTPQGQLASSWAATIANANAIFVYFAQQTDPAYASGRFQDAIARIYDITREPALPTALQVACNGAQGVQIPINALIKDGAGNLYQCIQPGTIPSGGSIVLSFAASIPGPTPVPPTCTIVQIIPSWDSVTIVSGAVGRNVEGTAAFEARRQDTVAGNSFGAIGSIIGAVAKVPGVLDYYGFSNNTAAPVTVNSVTIAANSIYVAVAGGAPFDVATAILSKKSGGAPMTGNTTVTVYDNNPLYASPIAYSVIYEIPPALQVLFKVTIANGPLVPSNYQQQIQSALLAAFAGTTLTASFVGAISGTTLTVTELDSGAIVVGQLLGDTTGAILANTTIVGPGTGTGGVGTYQISQPQTVASEAMTSESTNGVLIPRARINSLLYAIQYVPAIAQLGSWAQVAAITIGSSNSPDAIFVGHIIGTVMTVVSVTSGTIALGDYVSDANGLIINGTVITSFGTGTGGTGTYNVNNTQNFGASFTGTGSGTNLTATAVTGKISVGDVLAGTGVPGGTTVVSQSSGTPGGAGVYVTSASTTSSGVTLTANETIKTANAGSGTSLQVQANQTPQLSAPNIIVTTT